LLVGLVRVGFYEVLALGIEKDQRNQPTHRVVALEDSACPRGHKSFSFNGLSGCCHVVHSLASFCSC
jgi:hypothetical protein